MSAHKVAHRAAILESNSARDLKHERAMRESLCDYDTYRKRPDTEAHGDRTLSMRIDTGGEINSIIGGSVSREAGLSRCKRALLCNNLNIWR